MVCVEATLICKYLFFLWHEADKMAKSDKELKPLLDKSSHQHHQQAQQQCHTSSQKKLTAKGKTSSKPKLFSVSETSVEAVEGSVKEGKGDQCSEKDVDETETQKMKQSKKSTQDNLSPRPPQQLQTSTGEMLDQHVQNFGVKSYLHHFYESVSQTPSVVSCTKNIYKPQKYIQYNQSEKNVNNFM